MLLWFSTFKYSHRFFASFYLRLTLKAMLLRDETLWDFTSNSTHDRNVLYRDSTSQPGWFQFILTGETHIHTHTLIIHVRICRRTRIQSNAQTVGRRWVWNIVSRYYSLDNIETKNKTERILKRIIPFFLISFVSFPLLHFFFLNFTFLLWLRRCHTLSLFFPFDIYLYANRRKHFTYKFIWSNF